VGSGLIDGAAGGGGVTTSGFAQAVALKFTPLLLLCHKTLLI
jgi:hypothetical protein